MRSVAARWAAPRTRRRSRPPARLGRRPDAAHPVPAPRRGGPCCARYDARCRWARPGCSRRPGWSPRFRPGQTLDEYLVAFSPSPRTSRAPCPASLRVGAAEPATRRPRRRRRRGRPGPLRRQRQADDRRGGHRAAGRRRRRRPSTRARPPPGVVRELGRRRCPARRPSRPRSSPTSGESGQRPPPALKLGIDDEASAGSASRRAPVHLTLADAAFNDPYCAARSGGL